MKFRLLCALSVAVACGPMTVLGQPQGPIEVNGIAAKVNGQVITRSEVNMLLAPSYLQLVSKFPRRGEEFERQFKEEKARVIQELIDRQIILDEFKQLGATIKPSYIDEEIDRQIRDQFNGSEERFREELKKSRLTMEGYRRMTRDKLVVDAMKQQQAILNAPPPLPDEIRKEYNNIKLQIRDTTKDQISFMKIYIPRVDPQNPLSTPETQLALAESLVKQLKDGKDFAELAKSYSRDAFAEAGGVQEDVPRMDLSSEFAAIIFDAKEGELLGPLEDPQGFTIVKVTHKDLGPSPALSEVRDMVENRVRADKSVAQYNRWIESRRKRAMIDIKDD
ncbi:peptidylprolyl isomerase [Luteolibacter pohnpeiensis]|uniref:peptidylprolyl isomerase n=1 Tax=Luteolibacter pohnpeiensis TaxID=454153 RepID=A0A934VTP9_9BACT|nr:peptidylprolyl isomerase [Luteolibacter pohnpeiensis]MBK1881707.1 peptidylprolyl isomerase [Luteolibacter pohnpeiensis]